MKECKLTIQINKPVSEVFAFCMNPKNTPVWISSIVEEKTSEWPVKQGTIFQNRGQEGPWNEYEVIDFIENQLFVLSQKNGAYHVRYTFTSLNENLTELEYFEWMDEGELEGPFTQEALIKLKQALED